LTGMASDTNVNQTEKHKKIGGSCERGHQREYLRHRLIGTPLEWPVVKLREGLTRWRLRNNPVGRDAIFEDRFLHEIIRRQVKPGMNCVDVGAHLGAVTNLFCRLSPGGKHTCVEPTPYKARWLRTRYANVDVIEAAISDQPGFVTFYHQKNNSGYSGLGKHDAGINDTQEVEELRVRCDTLDVAIPADRKIGFVKIDVEGAELMVLRGATRILNVDRPTIIFECTKSGVATFGIDPTVILTMLNDAGYQVSTPRGFLTEAKPLSAEGLCRAMEFPFEAFSFIAAPSR
jgi:FkbM family methyltransferase